MKQKRTLLLALILLVLPALGGAAIATAERDLGVRFSSGSNRGSFVVARAHGTVSDVQSLYVKVTSSPKFKIAGSYLSDCDKLGNGGTKGGKFRGKTPVIVEIEHRFTIADRCQVSASAQAGAEGRVTVALYVKHSPGH